MTENKKENVAGITLVAIVVTIVVLLILAGITLIYVLGDSGIIQKAQEAANATQNGQEQTEKDLQNLVETINKYSNSTTGNNSSSNMPDNPSEIQTRCVYFVWHRASRNFWNFSRTH